jgi:hypothetical protein
MRNLLKLLVTLLLVLSTLGIGTVGLCAFRGLTKAGTTANDYRVLFGLVIAIAIAGIWAAVIELQRLWRREDPGESSPHDP